VQAEVLILLATFNGGLYLPEQLKSIERQTFTNWRVLASDDGSSDETIVELDRFRSTYPDRVELLNLSPSGSARSNFFRLLRQAPAAQYVAFCDQDDVWAEQKLERLVSACADLERAVGADTPCLVYSDLVVVGRDLRPIAPSYLGEIAADPATMSFGSTLMENSIPGCSMLINHSLVEEFRRYDGELSQARMHDWWLALMAFSMGSVSFVPEKLVLYRQHSTNTAGSVKRRALSYAFRKLFRSGREETVANVRQGQLFLKAYGSKLSNDELTQLSAFSQFEEMGKVARISTCLRLGILKQTTSRRLYQLIKI
jgi:glycosyltransferase involved in cell wall biosynthesis